MAPEDYYNHGEIEDYWQYVWADEEVFTLEDDADDPTYVLGMFPYTSGDLHVGHVRNYTITDAYARFARMRGEDVLHPMGWDAFGLPAETAAHERGTDPQFWTESCIDRMREEMREMGFGYDWSREIATCDPDYYRWTQWLVARLFEADLLEYTTGTVNWCPQDRTVLANEQVHDGACWQCGTTVESRELEQWFLSITDYADDLLAGLDDLDGWPDHVRTEQRNWIGRQDGATVTFDLADGGSVTVFTTRLDTIFGATYVAVSPEHDLAAELGDDDPDVAAYLESLDPSRTGRGEGGVEASAEAVHPVTGEHLPVYVADYVLEDAGTGAVMGVPAHDARDHAFAQEHDLPVRPVVESDGDAADRVDATERAMTDDGILVDAGTYEGLSSEMARDELLADLESASPHTEYRLEDWCVSRQRYWGTPIPIVHCESCGPVVVPDEDLPIELPDFDDIDGTSLADDPAFAETTCPECGREARRETDTMDTFVDSAWYYLRYLSPELDDAPFDVDRANDWLPVDWYIGGDEHAVLHLLYIRFFTRALADLDLLDHEEPIENLLTQGMVLHDGTKMGKSEGNAVTTEDYGADSLRLFTLEAAQPENDFDWTARRRNASYEFQKRVYRFVEGLEEFETTSTRGPIEEHVDREIDAAILAITEAYEGMRFYDAIREIRALTSRLQEYREYATPNEEVLERGMRVLVKTLAPITPHLCEELWLSLGDGLVAEAAWPEPLEAVHDYERQRALVEETRGDVRAIWESIDGEPETITLVVAPEWKHHAHDLAVAAEEDRYETVMADDGVPAEDEAAQSYVQSLAERGQALTETLSAEREYEALERASWLFEKEFGADVRVEYADTVSADEATRAEPGKPGIVVD